MTLLGYSPVAIAAAVLAGIWLAAAVIAILRAGEARAASPALADMAVATLPEEPASPAARDWASEVGQRLRRLPVSVWLRDADLNIVGVNEAYAQAVGTSSPEDAVSRQLELAPGTRALAGQARARRRSLIAKERVVVDGRAQTIEVVNVPLGRGDVLGFTIEGAERQAEDEGGDHRARLLADALDQLPNGVAIFDASRALWLHNRAFAELFALDAEWLESRPDFDRLLDAMRETGRLPERKDFPTWRAERHAWFAQAPGSIEETWTLPGGEVIRVTAKPRGDGCLLVVFEDQTERVLLAGTRDTLLEVHQATLDHLNDGVAVFGPDGKLKLFNRRFADIVLVSPETLTARPSAELLMAHVAALLNEPERAKGLRELILAATAGRAARAGRVTSTLGFVLDYASVPLPDGNALITVTDVTGSSAGEVAADPQA